MNNQIKDFFNQQICLGKMIISLIAVTILVVGSLKTSAAGTSLQLTDISLKASEAETSLESQLESTEQTQPFVFTQDVDVERIDFLYVMNDINNYDVSVVLYIPILQYDQYEEEINNYLVEQMMNGDGIYLTSGSFVDGYAVCSFDQYRMSLGDMTGFLEAIFGPSNVTIQTADVSEYFDEATVSAQWRSIIDVRNYLSDGKRPDCYACCKVNKGKVYPVEKAYAPGVHDSDEIRNYSASEQYRGFRGAYSDCLDEGVVIHAWMMVVEPEDKESSESENFYMYYNTYSRDSVLPSKGYSNTENDGGREDDGSMNSDGSDETAGEKENTGKEDQNTENSVVANADVGEKVVKADESQGGSGIFIWLLLLPVAAAIVAGLIILKKKEKKTQPKMVVFCSSCGALAKDGDKVCRTCGNELKQ